ncbi:Holliday junction branch migration protein RuvA [Blautia sp.]|uniref:Holliday junction branch migration protein RuvA n=3 Tax=Blautia sp. TaxID=1955243 RepID=UPI00280A9327|nr:Holliday junction branch migration protein RuvA [Blautia sp.]MDY3018287.1 Holliday junction branch migration protein RuvA [Blautia sp.]
MISFIRGQVVDSTENSVIVETAGIGYEIFMTGTAIEKAVRSEGKVKIHTYFHVREDVMQLFGFLSRDDLHMFRLLLGVNGIGPKAALGVLAGLTADELSFAILSDDVKTLSRAPGIGKKTAQKLILELKDKLKLEDAFEKKMLHQQEEAIAAGENILDGSKEAVEALVALGYSSTDALRAVRKITDVAPDDVEAILKAALKNL